MLLRAVFCVLMALPAVGADCATNTVGFRVLHFGGRVTAIWYPTNSAPSRHAYSPRFSGMVAVDAPAATVCGKRVPLVIFSHGDLGCGLQSVAFTEELARHGYVVAAPDHADAFLCHTVLAAGPPGKRPPQPNFLHPDTWDDGTFAGRREDVEAVIEGLLADAEFQKVIDPQRIGAAGHSLGGYTVVGMAGGWPKWLDQRIRAVLAFSPYVMPFQVHKTLGGVRVPLMYQGGTADVGITPFLVGPTGAYADGNPPLYFVELARAAHLAWVNCGDARDTASCLATRLEFRLIDQYGVAFLNRYLKDMPEPVLDKKDPSLAAYEFKLPKGRGAEGH